MASRSSLVVNARVHLSGSRGRAAVASHNVEYIATRPGADRSATPDDLRRAELAERMGLAGYYAERPGSTALFDEDGAVPLRVARKRLEEADGALATLVVSVRRDEADELRLADKSEWEGWCRANLRPALAEAMGVPESSVRWIAAEHENAEASKHVHVIAWSSDGSFDSLMRKARLERARNMLTDAALEPALKAELAERDVARSAALDAARAVPAEEITVGLPPDGRVSYAHLRRWHPDYAREIDAALRRAEDAHPELAAANERFRESVARCAELKGLKGPDRDRYVAAAEADLRAREANALLRTVAPDRTRAPERPYRPAPGKGPSTDRRLERHAAAEIRACSTKENLKTARDAVRAHRPIPAACLRECPTYSLAAARAPIAVARALAKALGDTSDGKRRTSLSDEAGKKAERIMARALVAAASAALRGDAAGVVLAPAKELAKGIIL